MFMRKPDMRNVTEVLVPEGGLRDQFPPVVKSCALDPWIGDQANIT
jgi:hypothetical protein